jgi:hypothetical protein
MYPLIRIRTAICLGALLFISSCCAHAQQAASVRVGTCDSRALALAYYNSPSGQQKMQELKSDFARAKTAGDPQQIKELEAAGIAMQELMHEQVFSTGSIRNIILTIQDRLPDIARQAGVALLVSKWDVSYRDPSVEYVDVTLPLVRLFSPSEKTLKWIEELKNQEPVPIDSLPRGVLK